MSITRMPIRDTFISFLECEIRGFWQPADRMAAPPNEIGWSTYTCLRDEGEIVLVRPDGLRRRFSFKNKATIAIGHNMVKFYQEDVIDELSVDEDAKSGKPSRPTVV